MELLNVNIYLFCYISVFTINIKYPAASSRLCTIIIDHMPGQHSLKCIQHNI